MATTNRTRYHVAALALCSDDADMDAYNMHEGDDFLAEALAHLNDLTRSVKRALAVGEIDRTPSTPDSPEIGDYTHFAPETF